MRAFLAALLVFSVAGLSTPIRAQLLRVSGSVTNAADQTPLPFASVRVEGTTSGTTADRNGAFSLYLPRGTHTIVTSYIGFESTQQIFRLTADGTSIRIALKPGQIEMPVFTVTPGDNPALRIIRQAIESKERRKEKLLNYRLTSHSKLVVKASDIKGVNVNGLTDTSFTAILESQTDAWWAKPNRSKEIVKARKQTAFIPAQSNIMISSFFIIDFSQDLLRLGDKAPIVGPISEAGLRNYDYTLSGSTVMDGEKVYRIDIAPISEHDPLLIGSLYIADGTFALTELDVSLNAAAMPTFFKRLRFRQHFRLFEKQFWMPVDVVVDADISVSMIVSISLALEGLSVLQDYGINEQINEDFFDRTRIKVLQEADHRDSIYWADNQKIPNSEEELKAYKKSDSIKTILEAQRNLFGLSDTFFGKTFVYNDVRFSIPGLLSVYRFNRVEGNALRFSCDIRSTGSFIDAVDGELGYGFSDTRWKYAAGFRLRTGGQPGYVLAALTFDKLGFIDDDHRLLSELGSTAASLLAKYDEKDYFRDRGLRLSLSSDVLSLFPSSITFSHHAYGSIWKKSDWSITRQSWEYRDNPQINDGSISSLQLTTSFDNRDLIDNAGTIRRIGGRSFIPTVMFTYNTVEIASHSYQFLQYAAAMNGSISYGQFGISTFRVSAAFTSNDLPTQRILLLPGSVNHIIGRWRFRTLSPREYGGDRVASLMFEHDFGDQLFRSLHIPVLQGSGFSLIVYGNAGWSTLRDGTRDLQTVPVLSAARPVYEVGIGIDRILLAFRLEAAWRLSHYRSGRNFFLGVSAPFIL